jgi:hypothetical protein
MALSGSKAAEIAFLCLLESVVISYAASILSSSDVSHHIAV